MTTILFAFCFCILHLNTAKQANIAVTLHRKDISLFSGDEIFGVEYKNKTEDIVQLNVVIDEMDMDKLNKDAIIEFDIIYPDIAPVIERSMARINNRTRWTASMKPDLFFQQYRDWVEYVVFIDALLLRFQNLASRSYLPGQTIQGRDIPVIRLSTDGDLSKPALYIQAEVHCREWLANAATMYILNAFAEGYTTNADITTVLNAINIFIVPTVNIDGYIYTWTNSDNRMWRKNRRQNSDGSYGVDLNRNYDGPVGTWCTVGASSNPSSNTYCGTAPYSEPEAAAATNFVVNATYNIGATVDMHTSGPYILYPWAYTRDQVPEPYTEEMLTLANDIYQAIKDIHGVDYWPQQAISGLTAGTFRDCPFGLSPVDGGNYKIFSFTWEGRGPGFDPPASNIIPAGQEQLAGMLQLARWLMNRQNSD